MEGGCPADLGPLHDMGGLALLQRGGKGEAYRHEAVKEMEEMPLEKHYSLQAELSLDDDNTGPLPLCHDAVVQESCRKIGGEEGATSLSRAQLPELLSLNESTADALWLAIGGISSEAVDCKAMCAALVDFISGVGVLPPRSDTACYTAGGKASCDVDVSPHRLVVSMKSGGGVQAASEETQLPPVQNLVQRGIVSVDGQKLQSVVLRGTEKSQSRAQPEHCPSSLWQAATRLANAFRIFPTKLSAAKSRMAQVSSHATSARSGQSDGEGEKAIAAAAAQAKAWVSTVLLELATQPMSSLERSQTMLSLNLIQQELGNTRYIYSADAASESSCRSGVLAYTWEAGKERGPVCLEDDDPMTTHCASDHEGQRVVYVCSSWGSASEGMRASALVHEASQTISPGEGTSGMGQILMQVDGEETHQLRAQELAAASWGCNDESPPRFPFTCSPSSCTCANVAGYCNDVVYGATIREQCPATCGTCTRPVAPTTSARPVLQVPTEAPRSSSPAPAPSPQGGCEEDNESKKMKVGKFTYQGTCESYWYNNLCHAEHVKRACPISCGTCVKPGCEDYPDFSVDTKSGKLTCQDWRRFTHCWKSVEPWCPTACRTPACVG